MRVKVDILGFSVDPSSSPTFGLLWLGHVAMEEDVMYTKKITFSYLYMEPSNLRSSVRPISRKTDRCTL